MLISIIVHVFITCRVVCRAEFEFSAVSEFDERFVNRMYIREWNPDPPSGLDPAIESASTRSQLCEQIVRASGAFTRYGKELIDTPEIYADKYSYTDPFELRSFKVAEFDEAFNESLVILDKTEYVFVCPLKDEYDDDVDSIITPLYVSKIYGHQHGLHSHRFAFLTDEILYDRVMLVERSAHVYLRPDFNVELHYLELRKYRLPAPTCEEDPVCRLSLGRYLDNQNLRLCTIVLTSFHYKKAIARVGRIFLSFHLSGRVSFGANNGERFHERMLQCSAVTNEGYLRLYFISRAYNPYEVLVYTRDLYSETFLLEALVTNVSIVHDFYNFGDVEI